MGTHVFALYKKAVWQKSRWIIGIVFQEWKKTQWPKEWVFVRDKNHPPVPFNALMFKNPTIWPNKLSAC